MLYFEEFSVGVPTEWHKNFVIGVLEAKGYKRDWKTNYPYDKICTYADGTYLAGIINSAGFVNNPTMSFQHFLRDIA